MRKLWIIFARAEKKYTLQFKCLKDLIIKLEQIMKDFNESRLIDEANKLMKEDKFNEAIKRFNYILHINPNSRGAITGKEFAMGLRDKRHYS